MINIEMYKIYCADAVRVLRVSDNPDEIAIALMMFDKGSCLYLTNSVSDRKIATSFSGLVFNAANFRAQAIKNGDI